MDLGEVICSKTLYDNIYNYRYIIKRYDSGIKTVEVIMPYKGTWIRGGTLIGSNISFTV